MFELLDQVIGNASVLGQRRYGFATGNETFRAVLDYEASALFALELAPDLAGRFEEHHLVARSGAAERHGEPGDSCTDYGDALHAHGVARLATSGPRTARVTVLVISVTPSGLRWI